MTATATIMTTRLGKVTGLESPPSSHPRVISHSLGGTGSNYDLKSSKLGKLTGYLHYRSGMEFVGSNELLDLRTAAEHLTNIRGVFNLPMAELGALFKVSRQSIYKWLQGTEPDEQKLDKVRALSQIADQFKELGVMRASAIFKMKAFEGKSLYQLFKDGDHLPRNVSTVIDEARLLKKDYEDSALKDSKTLPRDEWRSYLSIPGGPEPD